MGNYSSLLPDPSVDATLYYFDGRGKADQIRWVLAAANVQFVERKVDTLSKFKLLVSSLPFNKIPYLQIDGIDLVETQTIIRYIAKRSNLTGQRQNHFI